MIDDADREHPAAEKLSAYEANELSPEESETIRQHVAGCSLCVERLADLRRFLDFVPEERQAVADLETAAEWRKLRGRLKKEPAGKHAPTSPAPSGSFFRSTRGGYSLAAASLAVAVALGVWNLSLIQKSREPIAARTTRTLYADGSSRGLAEAERPVILPAQIALEVSDGLPARSYRVDVLPEGSRFPEFSLEVPAQESDLVFLLPDRSLRPGKYRIEVHGLRNGQPSSHVLEYELTVGTSGR